MELFWDRGFEATGMAQLVEHVGIGRQSLYNAFGDKHSLFLEALEAYDHAFLQRLFDLLEAPGSPLGNVRRVCKMWEQLAADGEFKGCLYASASAFRSATPQTTDQLCDAEWRIDGQHPLAQAVFVGPTIRTTYPVPLTGRAYPLTEPHTTWRASGK